MRHQEGIAATQKRRGLGLWTATVATMDLARRPRRQIRGPKALWWPTLLVQPFGPVAYLGWGRRRGSAPPPHRGRAGRARRPSEG